MDNVNASGTTVEKTMGVAKCVGLVGPMKAAWAQTFQEGMNALSPIVVIFWHQEWIRTHCELWRELYETLVSASEKTRILVIIFGDTPDQLGDRRKGNPLNYLLKAMVEDASQSHDKPHGCGWASISDVKHFDSAAIGWERPVDSQWSESALLRLCDVCAKISESRKDQSIHTGLVRPDLQSFFEFLHNPKRYRALKLHDAREQNQCDAVRSSLRSLKWLASNVFVPRKTPLKILVVENKMNDLVDKVHLESSERLRKAKLDFGTNPFGFFPDARFYVIDKNFTRLKAKDINNIKSAVFRFGEQGLVLDEESGKILWNELDLILQDIVLDKDGEELEGLELAKQYFEVAPQALVFVLTNLDVESLVGSGDVDWKYVDCIVSKDSLETIWYEYWRCFRERFGRMFWAPWINAKTRLNKKPLLDDRQGLRDLFGCLRKWQIEPAILGHGQGVQEMIDHSHRHLSGLWRLADDVIGTFVEHALPREGYLSVPERMLFAMSVWLHDIGHRGDDFTDDSGEIRANHAGISEYLLLRNPKAFGIEWLLDYCPNESCRNRKRSSGTKGNELLKCRNRKECAKSGEICSIRKLGLLCRHHQSNAPLDEGSLKKMSEKGKVPSPFSRVAVDVDGEEEPDSQKTLEQWFDTEMPLTGWHGSEIRLLSQFKLGDSQEVLLSFAGLLRMLDALQLHRSRVGSPTSIESFKAYLDTRLGWCRRQLHRVERIVETIPPGTQVHQRVLGRFETLRRYERLLCVQYVHFWRQIAVHDVSVNWVWYEERQSALRIVFKLSVSGLESISELGTSFESVRDGGEIFMQLKSVLKTQVDDLLGEGKGKQRSWFKNLKNKDMFKKCMASKYWTVHTRDDVILTEHKSQMVQGKSPAYVLFLPDAVSFEIVASLDSDTHSSEKDVLLLGKGDFHGKEK